MGLQVDNSLLATASGYTCLEVPSFCTGCISFKGQLSSNSLLRKIDEGEIKYKIYALKSQGPSSSTEMGFED